MPGLGIVAPLRYRLQRSVPQLPFASLHPPATRPPLAALGFGSLENLVFCAARGGRKK